MTEPALPDPTLNDTQGQQSVDTGASETGHPAWSNMLDDLPESVRPLVRPKFEEWDKNVQQLVGKVHSEYEPYKAWQPIAAEYDPDTAMQAIQLLEALNEDPERVYRALQENFGYDQQTPEQGQPNQENVFDVSEQPVVDPRLQTVEEMTNAMAEIMLSQQRAQDQAREDAELEQYLGGLKEQYGDYDEEYVLAHMHLGLTGEEAIQKFQALQQQFVANRPQAPTVMGSGGGLPTQAIDVNSLDSKSTKALVAQFLAQANNEGGS